MKSVALSLCVAVLALSGCKEKSQPVVPEASNVPVVEPSVVQAAADEPGDDATQSVDSKTLAAVFASLYPIGGDGESGLASFKRPWTRYVDSEFADDTAYKHEVCLRKRVENIEYVAVCQSTDEGGHPTPGLIDVHAFDVSEPAVRVVDSRRGITSNGFGHPQEPEWLQIGPATYAIVISTGYTATGETTSEQSWLVLRDREFVTELSVSDYHAYEPGCDENDADCSSHSQSCKPELLKTKPVDAWGRWPVLIRATKQVRKEHETTRTMLLTSNANGYVFSSDDALKLECDDG